jgi:phosphoglycerate kinase
LAEGLDKIVLPVDSLAAAELKTGVKHHVIAGDLPDDMMGLDIGPDTLTAFRKHIVGAKTIVWNGPVGAFEIPPFDTGTFALARAMAEATDAGAVTVIGGGDSAAAVEKIGLADRMSHISTGGGASLEFLAGKELPGIACLMDA